MAERPTRLWQELTAPEAAEALALDPVVVLPLAAVEQHGPHLPLSTDLVIGTGLLERALQTQPDEAPVWTLPPVAAGASREHERFPGTVSLNARSLEGVIHDVGSSLARGGVRRLVLANSHGGNRHAMAAAALALRAEHGLLVIGASYFRFPRPDDVELPADEWRHGLHGGAVETAMMLALRPDLVRTHAIRSHPSLGRELERSLRVVGPEGPAPFAWLASDLGPQGVVGDARLATAEMGERLLGHYGRLLGDVLRDARDFPLDRLR